MASKQLLPVFGKPMIPCLRSILMLAGIRNIFIAITSEDRSLFRRLRDDGSGIGTSSMLIRTVRADWRSLRVLPQRRDAESGLEYRLAPPRGFRARTCEDRAPVLRQPDVVPVHPRPHHHNVQIDLG
ncbi:sugar phosphate nucleotidyltransferase [Bradyrhizobium japonicum]|uniref:sugar phosphate nucleotidyltransferase n=1 Tax=Bradyrhizobium japonicum TaxID=375 RepID=UPI003221ADC9